MTSILVVEDEAQIAAFVQKGLVGEGYEVSVAPDGQKALALIEAGGVDMMLLDIGLPGIDGFEVLRRVRDAGHTMPVIIVTARDSVNDTVAGLEGGANDYITKPFEFAELMARVRVQLRDLAEHSNILTVGDLSLDLRSRQVTVDGRTHNLTSREFALLEVFLRHHGEVLTREQVLAYVWQVDFDPNSNVVDVYVRALRVKIGQRRIQTVRGVGYRLVTE